MKKKTFMKKHMIIITIIVTMRVTHVYVYVSCVEIRRI